ncbi:MAG: MotA/TolQ/ExbB proton channel family protein [Alphaproteobacteria bacterium]
MPDGVRHTHPPLRPSADGGAAVGRPDIATILGVGGAIGLIVTAIALGGDPVAFFDVKSVLIVLGGTFAVTMTNFSLGELFGTWRVVFRTLVTNDHNPGLAAATMVQLARLARRRGILGMQTVLNQVANRPFLYRALILLVDGMPGDQVERVMQREIAARNTRHGKSAMVLRRAGDISPAMGLIGTLVGLVQMLGGLDDPSTIGPAMAVALLTTFYGAILANVVFLPLAGKLERNTNAEAMVDTIFLQGVASIGRQENPRRLQMTLNTLLPPEIRIEDSQ